MHAPPHPAGNSNIKRKIWWQMVERGEKIGEDGQPLVFLFVQ
jgi:hypothetical protein